MKTQELFDSIPHDNTKEEVKIWDIDLESWDEDRYGRIRVMAIVPKRGFPLKSIPFAVSWCNPDDYNKFKKATGNAICAGRLVKFIASNYVKDNRNCGIIPELTDLKDFVEKALFHLPYGTLPEWVNTDQFTDPYLRQEASRAAIEGGWAPRWLVVFNSHGTGRANL